MTYILFFFFLIFWTFLGKLLFQRKEFSVNIDLLKLGHWTRCVFPWHVSPCSEVVSYLALGCCCCCIGKILLLTSAMSYLALGCSICCIGRSLLFSYLTLGCHFCLVIWHRDVAPLSFQLRWVMILSATILECSFCLLSEHAVWNTV